MNTYRDNITNTDVTYYGEQVSSRSSDYKVMPLGDFVNKTPTKLALSEDNDYVLTTESFIQLPNENTVFDIELNSAHIVWTYGLMNSDLKPVIETAVSTLSATDSKVSYIPKPSQSEFSDGLVKGSHPDVAANKATADYLFEKLIDNGISGNFMRLYLISNWANGSADLLWWCAHEQLNIETPPYSRFMLERELGMLDINRQPKPILKEMKKFSDWLATVDFELKAPDKDALILLTKEQDCWVADSETDKDPEYEEYNAAEYIYEQVGAYDCKEIFYPDASLWSMATAPIEKDLSSGTYRLTDSSEWIL